MNHRYLIIIFLFAVTNAETQKKLSVKKEEIVRKPVMVLNEGNFESVTSRGYTFVKFYAPWCGHCQMMEPDWEEVGEYVTNNPIHGVDLTVAEVRRVCLYVTHP